MIYSNSDTSMQSVYYYASENRLFDMYTIMQYTHYYTRAYISMQSIHYCTVQIIQTDILQ